MDDIVIAQPVDADIADTLSPFGRVWMNPGPDPLTAPELAERCRPARALMAFMTERIDAEFLERCPDLKIIAGALKGHDDLDVAEGHSEYLAGKLQERYGWTKEKAQQELRDFSDKL